ncbi:D-serine ammonia-lyase [Paraburkholderia sabiae]|uniref:Probable D-serine dehydratase n=1 Tax=Paraburkholderia sabiae TaxID=273251 RepID=A0ABU9QLI0_9BURK|nr:D-serine ammonia-lyase [Paraburkholderia sabiae]WJZ79267.1 D-serine ammonia-lyase [Paraburkholderia sabiae]CAD6560768.1 D-serine dehydratase [Paraburkholderia sabiae]
MIAGKSIDEWKGTCPLIADLVDLKETTWFNPSVVPAEEALPDVGLTEQDVRDASARLDRFAPYIARVFPQTAETSGRIESPIRAIPNLQAALQSRYGTQLPGSLWVKLDSNLPISGSIKARGGIYEVLKHAEDLAVKSGLLDLGDNYAKLDRDDFRAFFRRYKIAVGSTGNLGLSIGIMGATFGFDVTVHMSSDARQWKKDKLRSHGVTVVEHTSDYSVAVAEGRRQALADPMCHFIDDENSKNLFLGYAVAAGRLKAQLTDAGVRVDSDHPLFVYLPCGVGGGPGGVAFGLKLAFGDSVHCIFAEPTHSPCMFLGVYTGLHDAISVQDFGIDNVTAADGLAVGRPSGFVGKTMQRLIDGYYTVSDDELYALLALSDAEEGLQLEPSALAGAPGISRVFAADQQAYRSRIDLSAKKSHQATHLIWATGGSMVPKEEMGLYLSRGRAALVPS